VGEVKVELVSVRRDDLGTGRGTQQDRAGEAAWASCVHVTQPGTAPGDRAGSPRPPARIPRREEGSGGPTGVPPATAPWRAFFYAANSSRVSGRQSRCPVFGARVKSSQRQRRAERPVGRRRQGQPRGRTTAAHQGN